MKRKTPKPKNPKTVAWARSVAFRIVADAALRRFNARRHLLPKCGAKAKSTGNPCGNLALPNGRCRVHGGRTPAGDNWHRPVWPDPAAPDASEKLARKLRDLDGAARNRSKRFSKMTDEERAEHQRWQKAHAPGPAAKRAARKRAAAENASAREVFASTADPTSQTAEAAAIAARIAALEAQLALTQAGTQPAPPPEDVFG